VERVVKFEALRSNGSAVLVSGDCGSEHACDEHDQSKGVVLCAVAVLIAIAVERIDVNFHACTAVKLSPYAFLDTSHLPPSRM